MSTEVIENLTEAANKGDFKATRKLADLYMQGNQVKQDIDKAIELYESLCQRKEDENFEVSIFSKLGICYAMCRNFEKAYACWAYAAEKNDAEAFHNLGYCYQDGCGVEQDDEMGFEMFKKAADLGYVESMYEVGNCYSDGIGVEQDFSQSFKYWAMAAEQGDSRSMYNLAISYLNGYGVDENHEKAVELLLKAAKRGYKQAQYILGSCYQDGEGVDFDMALAVKWYRTAANNGHKEAQDHLEKMYKNGDIVESSKMELPAIESTPEQNIIDVIYSLAQTDKLYSGDGSDASAIEAAKEALCVEFSEDFVEYVQKFGSILVRDIELCAIVDNEYSTVAQTKKMRKNFEDFPIDCYVIENIGIDNIVMVQNAEGRVFQYKPEHGLTLAGNSLSDYLLNGDDYRKERREYWQARLNNL